MDSVAAKANFQRHLSVYTFTYNYYESQIAPVNGKIINPNDFIVLRSYSDVQNELYHLTNPVVQNKILIAGEENLILI